MLQAREELIQILDEGLIVLVVVSTTTTGKTAQETGDMLAIPQDWLIVQRAEILFNEAAFSSAIDHHPMRTT
jgi:hypothetical protein